MSVLERYNRLFHKARTMVLRCWLTIHTLIILKGLFLFGITQMEVGVHLIEKGKKLLFNLYQPYERMRLSLSLMTSRNQSKVEGKF